MHNQTPRNFLYNHRKSFYTVAWNHLTVYFLCFHVPSFCIICRIWFQNENFFLLSQWSSHQAKILPLGHIPLWVEFILYGTAKNRGDREKPVGGRAFLSDFVYWLVISIESLCANETATCFLLRRLISKHLQSVLPKWWPPYLVRLQGGEAGHDSLLPGLALLPVFSSSRTVFPSWTGIMGCAHFSSLTGKLRQSLSEIHPGSEVWTNLCLPSGTVPCSHLDAGAFRPSDSKDHFCSLSLSGK